VEAAQQAARSLLAWEDINDDEDTKKTVDPAQIKLLERNLAAAKRDLDEAIFRSYSHVYLLGKDNQIRHIDLGQINSSSGGMVELIVRELERCDELVDGVNAARLIKSWPGGMVEWSTKAVRDAFYSSPQLPRLKDGDSIKRTIADGVSSGALGYASKDASGQLHLEKLKASLFEGEVEISDEMFILKEADAKKLQEPSRLGARVPLINLSSRMQALANVVIQQRLEGLK
jgi:hypothetical protein